MSDADAFRMIPREHAGLALALLAVYSLFLLT